MAAGLIAITAIRQWRHPRWGCLFNEAERGDQEQAAWHDYAQTKAATRKRKSLAKPLAAREIRANSVAPGRLWAPLQISRGGSTSISAALPHSVAPATRQSWPRSASSLPRVTRALLQETSMGPAEHRGSRSWYQRGDQQLPAKLQALLALRTTGGRLLDARPSGLEQSPHSAVS
jgi:NAD(P)-dependent dehydrogenase (short-subunit alcohol dehydrogenase family)